MESESPLENHGIVSDTHVSYNLAVDAMWMYHLTPMNTDYDNLTFENNTIIHTVRNEEAWSDDGGRSLIGFVETGPSDFGIQTIT